MRRKNQSQTNDLVRQRIFISSIEQGYEHIRDAAERAIEKADCEPVRAENFPSRRTSPRTACLDGVASSDGIVLILGKRYAGSPTPSGHSATEEEYDEAKRLHKQILVYVEKTDHEPQQTEFIQKVSGYVSGHWRKFFTDAEGLETSIENDLKEVMPMSSGANENDARKRLDNAFANRPAKIDYLTWVQVAWTTLRDEEVIDPTKFIDRRFQRDIQELAHGGENPLLDFDFAKESNASATHLQIRQMRDQDERKGRQFVELNIYGNGTLAIALNVTGLNPRDDINFGITVLYLIDPDQLARRLKQAWEFANAFWNQTDEFLRHEPLLYDVALFDVGSRRLEKAKPNQQGISIGMRDAPNPLRIYDHPPKVGRAELQASDDSISHALKLLAMRFNDLEQHH